MNGQPRTFFHTPLIILAGLCAAQIIGTLQVFQSNARLLQTVATVRNAGYLAIPNDLVAPTLSTIKTACMGGLFFTLSMGAGVTLLALFSTWIWKYVCLRKPYLAIPLLMPWLIFIIILNLRGPAILPSLYFTAVPMLVSVLSLRLMPDTLGRSGWAWSCVHPAILLLLAVFWMTQYSPDMFSNIRDRLLLTHPPGIAFNNFYYRYTLYPAEVFKSLDQKMIKTCRVDGALDPSKKKQVLAHLVERNYLVVQDAQKVDLVLKVNGGNIELANRNEIFVQTSLKNFMENPGHVLTLFSKDSDGCLFFRQATFVSLLVAFPMVLYVFVNTLFIWLASFYFRPGNAAVLAAMLCLLAGCLLILPVRSDMQTIASPDRIPKLLQSAKWQDNVDALKAIVRKESSFPLNADAPGLATSPCIPVRYWLARSLARSTGSRTYAVLMTLMDDPQPIVVCQALYSLGRRNEAQSIRNVLHKINQSGHWYVQWYGYNALRDLGWRQKSSI